MEPYKTKNMKSKITFLWVLTSFILVLIVVVGLCLYNINVMKKENEKLIIQYEAVDVAYLNSARSRDSAFSILHGFKEYRHLMESMRFRDSVTSDLQHKIGDVVFMKPDSVRAVVQDVHIGGGAHDYYVKYQVRTKDTVETIIPEMIY